MSTHGYGMSPDNSSVHPAPDWRPLCPSADENGVCACAVDAGGLSMGVKDGVPQWEGIPQACVEEAGTGRRAGLGARCCGCASRQLPREAGCGRVGGD